MKFLILVLLVFLSACAMQPCRTPQKTVSGNEISQTPPPVEDNSTATDKRVLIYKYDGSLQCKMGKMISLNEMKADLKGIPVFSMEKKMDGQAHIQVCGSITGQANVFEISAKDLSKAEKLGFRTWSFK